MSAMSDYLEDKFRRHIFKATSYTMPTVLAIALHTSDPTDTGSTATEVANSNAYARTTLNPSAGSNWTLDGTDNGKVTNASDITFPTATGSWGTITHVGIWDSATYGGGNMLFSGALTASKTIGNGDVFKFLTGDLSITFQ